MIGQTLAHYRIVEKIGAGGMGEVYRAEDLHLARDVAIKVLPAGTLANEQARRRFRKEAEALSKLNHPNIQTVHDFDTQDGVDFLAVELVPGPTLADKLAAGALPEKEIASLGSQIAAALEEAHERGVVHRDLKPGNIKVTPKGQVKVLDFGLAKLLKPYSETATTESFTETHAAAGTLPYMAPEQLQGEGVDHRSDIWAAGVVLYEMATGRRPFEAKLATALAGDIQHKPVTPPSQLNPRCSLRLEEIILKCLEKDPEHRYQSAKKLGVDLQRLGAPAVIQVAPRRSAAIRRWALAAGGLLALLAIVIGLNVAGVRERLFGAGTPKIDSLAVLPLENLSRDPEQDYFADGMTDELIGQLAQISALKVISRTSVMQYKGARKPLPQIAKELNVDAVVEGTVQREGERVRIRVQLLHAPTDSHIWAESYERDLRDILGLQREVGRAIVNEIKVKLTPQAHAQLAQARRVNPEAYEAYLKGRYHAERFTPEGSRKSVEYLEQAIAHDPSYPPAYARLSVAYLDLMDVEPLTREGIETTLAKARAAARKAVELDDSLSEVHVTLGWLAFWELDWASAESAFQRAIELDTSNPDAHQGYTFHLVAMGRTEQAIAEIRRAQELDPVSAFRYAVASWPFYCARRYDEAMAELQKAVELDPNMSGQYLNMGQVYVKKGMFEQGLAAFQKVIDLSGERSPPLLASLTWGYAASGRKNEALKALEELKAMAKDRYVFPFHFSFAYAGLGEKELALLWLQRAYEERSLDIGWLTTLRNPVFDPLRSDPRFQALLRRMNFPE